MKTAIAVQAYNRPDELKITLDSLKANKSKHDVWIWVDGPNPKANEETVSKVSQSLDVARKYRGASVSAGMVNNGANTSLLMQMDYLFNVRKYDAVIQLCDDLMLSPNYIANVDTMLSMFQGDQRVGMVSAMGARQKEEHDQHLNCLTSISYQIGIATWSDRWLRWRRHVGMFVEKSSRDDYDGMREIVEKFGANTSVTGVSCDALLYSIMLWEDSIPVSTVANCLKNIGPVGAFSNEDTYEDQGWSKMPFYQDLIKVDYPEDKFFIEALETLRTHRNK